MLQNATLIFTTVLFSMLSFAAPAGATSLSVSPTRIEVPRGGAQTSMTVKSSGRGGSVVQLRIFRWEEGQNASRLKATRDIAISPPMARLNGRQELTIRIVRTSRRQIRGRECYRVLVDRLPESGLPSGQIGLRIRHSVPVCFTG